MKPRHGRILRVLLLFGATLVGLVSAALGTAAVVVFFGQRHLLFENSIYGDVGDPKQIGLSGVRVVHVGTSDGLTLTGWYKKAHPGCPTIIYFHGNEGDLKRRAFKMEQLLHAGYGAFFPEYRGYGGNPGKPSETGLYEDARSAIRFLTAEGIPPEKAAFLGESLGTGVAVRMASEFPPAALILEAPYTAMSDVTQSTFWFLPVGLIARDRFPSISVIGDVHVPLLLMHGDADETIPIELGKELLDAANEPKRGVFFHGAVHANLFAFGATDAIMDFLDPEHRCGAPGESGE